MPHPAVASGAAAGTSRNADAGIRRGRDHPVGIRRCGRRHAAPHGPRKEPRRTRRHHPGGRGRPRRPTSTCPGPTVIAIQRAPTSFHVAAATSIGAATADGREYAWRAGHSDHGAVRLPQRRAEDGRCRRRPAASVGTCWPASGASSPVTRAAAPSTRAAPRSTRSTVPRWTARCPATRSSSSSDRQSRHLRPRDGADAVLARHLGALCRPTVTATAYPTRRTCSTPRWRPPGTCAAAALNLRDPSQVMAAILRYNNSMSYAQNVLGWAAAYATGVVPVDLPPITGPPPPIGDAHLEHPEGLGPEPADKRHRPGRGDPMGAHAADRLRAAAAIPSIRTPCSRPQSRCGPGCRPPHCRSRAGGHSRAAR